MRPEALARASSVSEPLADIATVVENLKAAYPRLRIVSVDAPSENDATFVAVLEGRGRIKVACGPTDGKVLGEFPRRRNWLDVVQELHESLLIPSREPGPHVERGWRGVPAVVERYRHGDLVAGHTKLEARPEGGLPKKLAADQLRPAPLGGFWTILIASFWAVSGIYFGWPRQVFRFVNSLSPVITARPPAVSVSPEIALPELDLRSLVRQARSLDPGTTLGGIAFPYSRRAPLGILMRRGNSVGREYVDTVYFNPYSGDYISTWRYGVNQTLGDWIIWSQVPLHFGTYWGWGVKLVWATAGLAIPLLAITGLLMYWNRAAA